MELKKTPLIIAIAGKGGVGKTIITTLIAKAITACKVTIANDCGPSHIAQMMSIPYIGIFSNHDGNADERIAEWFYGRERAEAVTSEPLKDMKSIPIEQIERAVSQLLSNAETVALRPQ